jgi:hypothetical protein
VREPALAGVLEGLIFSHQRRYRVVGPDLSISNSENLLGRLILLRRQIQSSLGGR